MLERVQKIISNAGLGSRRKAEEWIQKGKVAVNGKIITIGDKADATKDKITVNGKLLRVTQKVYIVINKPSGYITTMHDVYGRKKVVDLLNIGERVYPVGRLDRETEGLLILTNDGNLANKIMHPRYEIDKTYLVRVQGEVDDDTISKIKEGMRLGKKKTSPAKVKLLERNKSTLMEISLHEGINRQIRRMFAEFGYKVTKLRRIRIGRIELGKLRPGAFRSLTNKELEFLKGL